MGRLDLSLFTVKQLLELDACTRCGECIKWCPTYAEKELEEITPLEKIHRFKSYAKAEYAGVLTRLFRLKALTPAETEIFSRGVYLCTLCGRCNAVCPVDIRTRSLWLSMREELVHLGCYPEAFDKLKEALTRSYNISGEDNAGRSIWSQNLAEVPEGLVGREGAETLYFVGCVSSFYPMVYSIPQSLVQVMARAKLDFTTLGGQEWCCGYPLITAGMKDAARTLARHNLEAVRRLGARRLVASCPSCYHTWRRDYPELLGEELGFPVVHESQLLLELVEGEALKLGPVEEAITYHDPCDLGRNSGLYEEPRRVLAAIPGLKLVEMAETRERSLCCGGGGDVEMGDAELTHAVAARRLGQAEAAGARTIVSACQQCKRTLSMAARRAKARVRVLDLSEVVLRSVSG